MILLDTNIIIELFKENKTVLSKIEEIGASNVIISKITILEMYVGAIDKRELNQIKKYLAKFPSADVTNDVINLSVDLIEEYYLSHSLYINDAIIASTCLENNYKLYTLNVKDFKFIRNLELI